MQTLTGFGILDYMTGYLWDYDKSKLQKTEKGRIFLLERMINYGPGKEKIKLENVRKYWDKLHLMQLQKRLFSLLLWGKYSSEQKSNKLFGMK